MPLPAGELSPNSRSWRGTFGPCGSNEDEADEGEDEDNDDDDDAVAAVAVVDCAVALDAPYCGLRTLDSPGAKVMSTASNLASKARLLL